MAEEFETRTVLSPRTGTKVCILIALLFAVGAVYYYFVPVTDVRTSTGAVFGCGSASSPATGGFAEGVCGQATEVFRFRAAGLGAFALLSLVVGGLLFGVDRRQERRPVRHFDDDDYHEHDRDGAHDGQSERGADRADQGRERTGYRRSDDSDTIGRAEGDDAKD